MIRKAFILMVGIVTLSSCNSKKIEYYKDKKPDASLKELLTGTIKGWGIIQDWRGRVVNRFDFTLIGTWKGNEGTLDEDFYYYDGTTQKRIWKIIEKEDGSYEGIADDFIGKGYGEQVGSAIHWKYKMDITVEDSTYRLSFDDWTWQMNDGVLINRAYFKKFGFTVGELTLFMKKEK